MVFLAQRLGFWYQDFDFHGETFFGGNRALKNLFGPWFRVLDHDFDILGVTFGILEPIMVFLEQRLFFLIQDFNFHGATFLFLEPRL